MLSENVILSKPIYSISNTIIKKEENKNSFFDNFTPLNYYTNKSTFAAKTVGENKDINIFNNLPLAAKT